MVRVIEMMTRPETLAELDRVIEVQRSTFRAVLGENAPPEPVPDAFERSFS